MSHRAASHASDDDEEENEDFVEAREELEQEQEQASANAAQAGTSTAAEDDKGEAKQDQDGAVADSAASAAAADAALKAEIDEYNALTDEEKQARAVKAEALKAEGNTLFATGEFTAAMDKYSEAIRLGPSNREAAAPYFANRAACYFKLTKFEECVVDCTQALAITPTYAKALTRRAAALEKQDKLEEALRDYKRLRELDPSDRTAIEACQRLPPKIEEQREKLKAEMFGKLKELGNMCLKPFGLSTNNFEFVKDPATGGYSMKFNQGAQ
eukprot:m.195111 g.195111  ORF g.195111 m.195111 type:complete len:271 (-) comp17631_c1_seq1:722-1534(-)